MKSMSLATSLSDSPAPASNGIADVRVTGGVGVHVEHRNGRHVIGRLSQHDGYKVRFPKRGSHPEAVIINTGGGVASGDCVAQDFLVSHNAALTATTQASERIYRQLDGRPATITVRADVGPDACFNWLPQETILFNEARLRRRFEIDLDATAHVLLSETLVLGRHAMGESVLNGMLHDTWRIKRGGALVYAEDVRLDDTVFSELEAPALAQGHRVTLTSILLSPVAEDKLNRIRKRLEGFDGEIAASAWNGMLVVRALASNTQSVRAIMGRLVPILAGRELPRVWMT